MELPEDDFFEITVKVNGQTQQIQIRETDHPLTLAKKFGAQHKLSEEKIKALAERINDYLDYEGSLTSQEPQVTNPPKTYTKPPLQRPPRKPDYSYKPQINPHSQTIATNNRKKGKVHDYLYNEAKKKKSRLSSQKTEDSKKFSLKEAVKVANRLISKGGAVKENQEKKRREKEERRFDFVKEEACSFKPQTGRPPTSPRRELNVTIGEYLYSQRSTPVQPAQEKPPFLASSKSLKLLSFVKKNRYRELFATLSPNSNGRIDSTTVESSQLPENYQRILAPLFEELKEVPEGLSFEDFCVAMNNLMKILSPSERSELYNTKRKKPQETQYTFKPQTNSFQIQKEKISERTSKDLVQKNQKLQAERAALAEKEVQGCTFVPKTKSFRPKHSITKKFYNQVHSQSHKCISNPFN